MFEQQNLPSTFDEGVPIASQGVLKDESSQRKKILLLTSSEYGQANVILAVAYELLQRQEYDVHIASFATLQRRVEDLKMLIPSNVTPATFHTIAGPSLSQCLEAQNEFMGPYPPGIRGALKTYRITLPAMATAYNEAQYMAGYKSCLDILKVAGADLIVIEPMLDQGLDACKTLSRSYVVLSPNTFQELLRYKQPKHNILCRNPAISSGFSYPVPWRLIPANISLHFGMILLLVASQKIKKMLSVRRAHGLSELPSSFQIWQPDNHYLVPSAPESEYPCRVPSNVTPCGPILLPVGSVGEVEPELNSWLQRGPTILINLGSMLRMDETMKLEFATGLKLVLDQRPEVQILWKIRESGGLPILSRGKREMGSQQNLAKTDPLDVLSDEIKSGRVKVLNWISVEPLALLQSERIVCSVHHGGSNSFHEALSTGVPQVILPCWLDTIDFANRVEWLGIGVHGSRCAAPSVKSEELFRALLKVLGDNPDATLIQERARELAGVTGRIGGRKRACEKIIELLESLEW
ncbi:glycosyltransferase family 1 protein [Stipitochalara longipes BDJ]|nr:glycosyltransferase family 1 protein [Stipitochalara longipes BDJ]